MSAPRGWIGGAGAALLVLLLTSCGRTTALSAPAPEGALQCALREAQDRGYTRVEGSDDRGAVRMTQLLRLPTAGAPPPEPLRDAGRALDAEPERQLLIRYADGELSIVPLEPGSDPSGPPTPGPAAAHAAEILTECAVPA